MNFLLTLIIIVYWKNLIDGKVILDDTQLTQRKPYENVQLFEGDILLPIESSSRGVARRGASVPWTNGIVPYEILPGYASTEQSFIISTMQKMERLIAINNHKCIQFRPKISSDRYYISIANGDGCSSIIGQNTGVNMIRSVSLQYPGCIDEGRIMHELLHTLGFYHEQSRPDRDNYVKINYGNIQKNMQHNFEKFTNDAVDTLNTIYDYRSLMHYESTAFSSNGRPTIEPLQPGIQIGQRIKMSSIDLQEVRLFYNCSTKTVTLPPIPTTTTANLYVINTRISSSLTNGNPKGARYNATGLNYYYDRYIVTVPVTGSYIFTTNSAMKTCGYFYGPRRGSSNLHMIAYNDGRTSNNQFQIQMYLQARTSYAIRVTTFHQYTTGNYALIVSGLNSVTLKLANTGSSLYGNIQTINKFYYILVMIFLCVII